MTLWLQSDRLDHICYLW